MFTKNNLIDGYLHNISEDPLPREKETELAVRIQNDDQEALDQLVRSNIRFVFNIAKDYRHLGVPTEDLLHEGIYGLIVAARKYDPDRGYRFITYAVWWIRHFILKSINERAVHMPMNVVRDNKRIQQAISRLEQELGRQPSYSEMAAEIDDMDEDAIHRTLSRMHTQTHSLDIPITRDMKLMLHDLLFDENDTTPDKAFETECERTELMHALQILSTREHRVIESYYMDSKNYSQIGKEMGVTREGARQIGMRAIQKLRPLMSECV